jgi:hypothetical protein
VDLNTTGNRKLNAILACVISVFAFETAISKAFSNIIFYSSSLIDSNLLATFL